MCESTVMLRKGEELTEVMENVAKIDVQPDRVICFDLLGERIEIEDVQIIEANLMEHRITLGKVK